MTLGLLTWSAVAEVEAVIAPTPAAPWRLAPLGLAIIGLWHARYRFRVPLNATRLKQAAEISAFSVTAIVILGGGGLLMERGRFETPVSTPGVGRALLPAWP
jgi:lysyl-tRNA synthetase class 2